MEDPGDVDSQQVEDRCADVERRDGVAGGVASLAVGGTEDFSAADAGSGHHDRVAERPVLPSSLGADPRRPAEFAHQHHQGVFQQASLTEFIEQGGDGHVGRRQLPVLEVGEVVDVVVPADVGSSTSVSPVDVDQRHADLDQSPGQQATLSEGSEPVA